MTTAPVKSHQPLHNFSLPFLKWGQRTLMNTNNRCRRLSESTRNSPPAPHRSSSRSERDSDSELENQKPSVRYRNRLSFASCSSQKEKNMGLERESNDGDVEREKVCDEADGEESAAKPWNLRPRKAVAKAAMETGSPAVPTVAAVPAIPKSGRLRGLAEGQGGSERKEKRKFWISLSRDEIEEDVYALTGSKPARRPKKRNKTVQKQLDNLFPGLHFVGVTADSYRLHDALK